MSPDQELLERDDPKAEVGGFDVPASAPQLRPSSRIVGPSSRKPGAGPTTGTVWVERRGAWHQQPGRLPVWPTGAGREWLGTPAWYRAGCPRLPAALGGTGDTP